MKRIILGVLIICIAMSSLVACGGMGGDEVSVFYYTYSDTYISSVRGAMERRLPRQV